MGLQTRKNPISEVESIGNACTEEGRRPLAVRMSSRGAGLTDQHQTRVSKGRPLKYGVEDMLAGSTELIHLIKHQ